MPTRWLARAPSRAGSRRCTRRRSTPLVGREEEIELLLRRWQQRERARAGSCCSRASRASASRASPPPCRSDSQSEPHTRLRYFCSPHHQDSALHPIIAQLERAAGFEREDTPEAKLDKLRALLAPDRAVAGGRGAAGRAAVDADRRPLTAARAHARSARRRRRFEALLRQLEGLARQRPVLMIFEDVHWIDPSSRELLDLVVERVPRLPVLLLVTFRPEFQPPWSRPGRMSRRLLLSRLDRREGAALVRRVAGAEALPGDVVDGDRRAHGRRAAVRRGADQGGAGGRRATPATAFVTSRCAGAGDVPATLHASLMARLDRLGPAAKEVAQIGAAIGREFSYELLAAVATADAAELDAALDQLVGAGLVFRRGTPPQATFLFKHALVQDAAYGTLLRGKRQELHGRVAQVLEEQWPETAETQPELLAHHCAQAGLVEQAIAYYARAGQRAVARSAMAEAIAQLKKGLELLTSLPDAASRQRQELELQIALGRALIAAQGYAAPAVGETYARARALCEQLDRPPEIVPVLYGQCAHYLGQRIVAAGARIAAELLQVGEHGADVAITVLGHRLSASVCFHLGEFLTSRDTWSRRSPYLIPGTALLHVILHPGPPGRLARLSLD